MRCDEDCLNCKYSDCIITSYNLKSLRLMDKRKRKNLQANQPKWDVKPKEGIK